MEWRKLKAQYRLIRGASRSVHRVSLVRLALLPLRLETEQAARPERPHALRAKSAAHRFRKRGLDMLFNHFCGSAHGLSVMYNFTTLCENMHPHGIEKTQRILMGCHSPHAALPLMPQNPSLVASIRCLITRARSIRCFIIHARTQRNTTR